MRFIYFLLFSLLIGAECLAQSAKAKKDPTLRLLTYGLPNFEMQNAENVVAARFGFHYYGVAGCDVNEALEDSVEKANAPVYAYLENTYGKSWQDSFSKEVEKEFEVQKEVIKLVDASAFIKEKQKEIRKESNGLEYILEEAGPDTYEVLAYGWGKLEPSNEDELLVYFHLITDLKKKSVKLISNKVRKL